jgi:hypothetical protein
MRTKAMGKKPKMFLHEGCWYDHLMIFGETKLWNDIQLKKKSVKAGKV